MVDTSLHAHAMSMAQLCGPDYAELIQKLVSGYDAAEPSQQNRLRVSGVIQAISHCSSMSDLVQDEAKAEILRACTSYVDEAIKALSENDDDFPWATKHMELSQAVSSISHQDMMNRIG